MELLSGTAKMVRHVAGVYGDTNGVGTSQGITFRVNNRAVELWSPSPPQIEEGDEVSVAGDVSNGVLRGRAYRNHSSGAVGRDEEYPIVTELVVKHLYGAVAVLGLCILAGPVGLLVIPGIWAVWGYQLADELKSRRAVRMVRSAAVGARR